MTLPQERANSSTTEEDPPTVHGVPRVIKKIINGLTPFSHLDSLYESLNCK